MRFAAQGCRQLLTLLGSAALVGTAVPATARAQGPPPASLQSFLQNTIHLNPDELRAVPNGKPLVKVMDTGDSREIAVFGVVWIDVPRAYYVKRASDFPVSLKSPSRVRFGIFSDPARETDVAAFSLPHDDAQELTKCRPGSCKVKLSSAAMTGVLASMDSTGPAPDSAANAFFRRAMLGYVTDYRSKGNSALLIYEDERATAAKQVFDSMLARSPYAYQYAPSLERYLVNYPGDRPTELSEVVFWAQDDLPSLRPTVTITHALVYAPPELAGCTLIVSKQLYASHYLDGGMTIDAVVDAADSSSLSQTVYLVLLRRLHFDDLPSGGVMHVRERVTSKLRDQTGSVLLDAKTRAEQAFASASASAR